MVRPYKKELMEFLENPEGGKTEAWTISTLTPGLLILLANNADELHELNENVRAMEKELHEMNENLRTLRKEARKNG